MSMTESNRNQEQTLDRKTHNRLRPVRTLAENDTLNSSRRVADSRDALEREQQQLEQLQAYLSEYQAMANAGRTASEIASRRDFVKRLHDAILQQMEVVDRLRSELENQLDSWKDARARSLALNRLAERADQAEREREDRRDQHRMDEIGQQSGRFRKVN